MPWEKITNIILISAFAVLVVFALLGIVQLIQRQSLKKVDREITGLVLPLALMTITYFLFDKIFILNTRPNGSGDPSFPSTHAMVVATIFFATMLALPKYIKSRPFRIVLDAIMAALIILTCIGRVAADLHWLSDVICGVVFAGIFVVFYYLIIKEKHHE